MADLLVVGDQKLGHIVDHAREVPGRHSRLMCLALALGLALAVLGVLGFGWPLAKTAHV